MKKLFALVLALVFVLGLSATAFAAPFYLESAGVTIEVPDGMTAEDVSDDEAALLKITVDGNENIAFAYMVRYLEEFEGKGLQDLTEEEAEQVGMGIGQALENPTVLSAEVNGYPVLVVTSGDGTQLHYIAILNGWMCDVAAVSTNGEAIGDADIQTAATLLTSITFDTDEEGEAEAGEEQAEEGEEEEAAE